jgi:hypothetical protein
VPGTAAPIRPLRPVSAVEQNVARTARPYDSIRPSLSALPDGEPSPGVLCTGPGCFERNTSKFGLRRVALCPACRAALEGRTYKREIPLGAARAIRSGAA